MYKPWRYEVVWGWGLPSIRSTIGYGHELASGSCGSTSRYQGRCRYQEAAIGTFCRRLLALMKGSAMWRRASERQLVLMPARCLPAPGSWRHLVQVPTAAIWYQRLGCWLAPHAIGARKYPAVVPAGTSTSHHHAALPPSPTRTCISLQIPLLYCQPC